MSLGEQMISIKQSTNLEELAQRANDVGTKLGVSNWAGREVTNPEHIEVQEAIKTTFKALKKDVSPKEAEQDFAKWAGTIAKNKEAESKSASNLPAFNSELNDLHVKWVLAGTPQPQKFEKELQALLDRKPAGWEPTQQNVRNAALKEKVERIVFNGKLNDFYVNWVLAGKPQPEKFEKELQALLDRKPEDWKPTQQNVRNAELRQKIAPEEF